MSAGVGESDFRGYPRIPSKTAVKRRIYQEGPLPSLSKKQAYSERITPISFPQGGVNRAVNRARPIKVKPAPQPEKGLPTGWKVTRVQRNVPTWDNSFVGPCHYKRPSGKLSKKPNPGLRSLAQVNECLYGTRMKHKPFCKGSGLTLDKCLHADGTPFTKRQLSGFFPEAGEVSEEIPQVPEFEPLFLPEEWNRFYGDVNRIADDIQQVTDDISEIVHNNPDLAAVASQRVGEMIGDFSEEFEADPLIEGLGLDFRGLNL